MEFSSAAFKDRKNGDLLAIPFWKEKGGVHLAIGKLAHSSKGTKKSENPTLEQICKVPLETEDFKGKEGEILIFYSTALPEKRIALLGIGDKEKITAETLRRAYGALAKACHARKVKNLHLLLPHIPGMQEEDRVKGALEGLLLANYAFTKHKRDSLKENSPGLIQKTVLLDAEKGVLDQAKRLNTICEGVYLARDMTNTNADEMTPIHLGELAQEWSKKIPGLKATLFDKKRIEKEKMGLILAVNRGSHIEPRLIFLEYRGNPKSKEHTVLVGKGITYDTGGLNIKGTGGMETMRTDMGGASAVLAAVKVAAELKLPVNVTAVVPATENSVSSTSYKPGDVYESHAGKTVEISNTDAEGRLVLADALSYVEKHLKPTRIIDLATLTGGVDIALGNEATGMMSNNDALADLLITAGSQTFERLWRLPLFDEYKEGLKSEVADMRNAATRSASPIIGGTFLKAFIQNTPWAHLDIASTAYIAEGKRYHPKLATGVGVRLLIEFLENQG